MFTHYVGKKEQLDRIPLHADNGNFKVYNLLIKLFDSLTSLCFFLCRVANSCNRHSLNTNNFPSQYFLDGQVFMSFLFFSQISDDIFFILGGFLEVKCDTFLGRFNHHIKKKNSNFTQESDFQIF